MHEMSGTQLSLSFFVEMLAWHWAEWDMSKLADARAAIIEEDICVNPE